MFARTSPQVVSPEKFTRWTHLVRTCSQVTVTINWCCVWLLNWTARLTRRFALGNIAVTLSRCISLLRKAFIFQDKPKIFYKQYYLPKCLAIKCPKRHNNWLYLSYKTTGWTVTAVIRCSVWRKPHSRTTSLLKASVEAPLENLYTWRDEEWGAGIGALEVPDVMLINNVCLSQRTLTRPSRLHYLATWLVRKSRSEPLWATLPAALISERLQKGTH